MVIILLAQYLFAYNAGDRPSPSTGQGTATSTQDTVSSVNLIDQIFLDWFRNFFGLFTPYRIRNEDRKKLEEAFKKVWSIPGGVTCANPDTLG